jgi:hypothetical protein
MSLEDLMVHRVSVTVVLVIGLVGCAAPGDEPVTEPPAQPQWQMVAPAGFSPAQQDQYDTGMAAKDAFTVAMMTELDAALDGGDVSAAIDVCLEVAPTVAARVGVEHGLALGRTSHRLRNPANTPPDWAAHLVEARQAEPVFLYGPAGELAGLFPIRLEAGCAMCHGTAETIPDDVAKTLAELYPEDRATGFEEGDLRGWLWFEVPAPSGAPSAS